MSGTRALRIGMTGVQEGQKMGRLEDGDKDQMRMAWTIWYPRYSTRAQGKNDFRVCLRVVEGTTPESGCRRSAWHPLPAVGKPHPMFAPTCPISGTLLRGAGQTLEASIMNAN